MHFYVAVFLAYQHACTQTQTTPTGLVGSSVPKKLGYSRVSIELELGQAYTDIIEGRGKNGWWFQHLFKNIFAYLPCFNILIQEKRAKTSDDSIPLPDPFPFPKHYSRGVEEALKNGQLPSRERRLFLSDIAAAMLRYKQYPSRDDYVLVSCAVCKEFPFLKATSGRPYVSICGSFYTLVTVP